MVPGRPRRVGGVRRGPRPHPHRGASGAGGGRRRDRFARRRGTGSSAVSSGQVRYLISGVGLLEVDHVARSSGYSHDTVAARPQRPACCGCVTRRGAAAPPGREPEGTSARAVPSAWTRSRPEPVTSQSSSECRIPAGVQGESVDDATQGEAGRATRAAWRPATSAGRLDRRHRLQAPPPRGLDRGRQGPWWPHRRAEHDPGAARRRRRAEQPDPPPTAPRRGRPAHLRSAASASASTAARRTPSRAATSRPRPPADGCPR